jgi:hypothetical protein
MHSLILSGLLLVTPANTNNLVSSLVSPSTQVSSKILIKDELYFGLSRPGNLTVSEIEWQLFLNRVITPRFKDGLTVMDTYGQYLNNDGKLTREKSKLVILIYDNSSNKNQMVQQVIASYKQRFQQESVLRVTSSVRVSF